MSGKFWASSSIILLSAWDRSHDSTAKKLVKEHVENPIFFSAWDESCDSTAKSYFFEQK